MKKIYLLTALVFVITSCSDNQKGYDATGTFEATEVTVAAKSSGELKHFTLNEGENLKANQVVGNIGLHFNQFINPIIFKTSMKFIFRCCIILSFGFILYP